MTEPFFIKSSRLELLCKCFFFEYNLGKSVNNKDKEPLPTEHVMNTDKVNFSLLSFILIPTPFILQINREGGVFPIPSPSNHVSSIPTGY